MSDLRSRLDRLGRRIEPRGDAFDRLEAARQRRARNRRIEAGVVAFAVAIAGSLTAFATFRDAGPDPGEGVGDGFFALWPEKTREEAMAGQADVEVEPGELAWRLDPVATAEEFARETLGWGWETPDQDVVDARVVDGDPAGVGPVTVEIGTPPNPCPSPGPAACVAKSAVVTLARLVRDDGIWSVVEVGGDRFDLPVDPGDEVTLGGVVSVPTTLEESAGVAVGVKGTGPCSGFREQFTRVVDGAIEIPIEGVGDGCAGYVYTLTPATPEGQVELGRIMFAWNEPKPALGYTIVAIAAIPVRFVEATDEAAPADVMQISCDGSALEVHTPVVETQGDGVHVELVNSGDHARVLELGDLETLGVASVPLPPGGSVADVVTIGPGIWPVACSSAPKAGPTGSLAVGSVEVIDPAGWFTPSTLGCPPRDEYSQDGPMEGITGDPRDPLDIARARVTGVEPTDILEPAGYGEAADPIVRIVRGGAIVGRLQFGWDVDSAGWMLVQLAGCSGSSFGWSVGPTPAANPDGWFEWCPAGPFPEAGPDWSERASEVAIRFALAYVNGDETALSEILDSSVLPGAEFPVVLTEDVVTVGATDAHGGPLVRYSCGSDVDAYTVAVTIDDGTDSASADFTVFLVFRDEGWKVWGVY